MKLKEMFTLIYKFYTFASFKGTLMQIWKSLDMFEFISKQYPENFAFLILRALELFTREVGIFLKK